MNQETLKRAKEHDIDFGAGQTLRGLLEDMELKNMILERALEKMTLYSGRSCVSMGFTHCPNIQNQITCQQCRYNWAISLAKAELAKEQQ